MSEVGRKAANIKKLHEIANLVPDPGIIVDIFEDLYPDYTDPPHVQARADRTIYHLLIWHHSTIVQLREKDEANKRELEANKRELEAIKGQLEEKDQRLNEKDQWLKEKDQQLKAKDQQLQKATNEASDIVTELVNVVKAGRAGPQKRGSVTRSKLWHSLEKDGIVRDGPQVEKEESPKTEQLSAQFSGIGTSMWKEEVDMYEDIIDALKSRLYPSTSVIKVVNTSKSREFPADVSIADHEDERLLYSIRYFIELKYHKANLLSPDNCGQMVDYFNLIQERQRHRSKFMGILSNFATTFVFEAEYWNNSVTSISKKIASTLADAVIYVNRLSDEQYQPIPSINKLFSSNYHVIDNSERHILLSAHASTRVQTRSKEPAEEESSWRDPVRFGRDSNEFVLKMARDGDLAKEIQILAKIREADCKHLPELVWAPAGDKELGIVPKGQPLDRLDGLQTAQMMQRVVVGLVDGLKYLHEQGIVHRDIRPSNLIIHDMDVVIVDFETAVKFDGGNEVDYRGGCICWPMRLLEFDIASYTPKPTDDLLACILVVLHLLFPSKFDCFSAEKITIRTPHTPETKQLIQLWKNIEDSKIWGPFVEAANTLQYERLKDMADVFCSV